MLRNQTLERHRTTYNTEPYSHKSTILLLYTWTVTFNDVLVLQVKARFGVISCSLAPLCLCQTVAADPMHWPPAPACFVQPGALRVQVNSHPMMKRLACVMRLCLIFLPADVWKESNYFIPPPTARLCLPAALLSAGSFLNVWLFLPAALIEGSDKKEEISKSLKCLMLKAADALIPTSSLA